MLDAYIIEEIKRQEEERRRRDSDRPRLHIEIPRPPLEAPVVDRDDEDEPEESDDGIIRIDL